uniref:RRM domain-containing protein n=1 Tax=Araucaria cunninghamii TaxID=56994 RepID=A0A0D6QZJ1_ARACU
MASSAGQPQFRYTQPPSKVLHLRNLPWECSEEELIELCKPFGKIVNTKCNVGANHNQAFVEFADLNQAIAMVSYYASSSEPAQVRGKSVYLQYSNRQEIVNNKSTGDVASNVLLVTIEGVEAGDVSIDVLHLVFSAFGFVHKIATFEKSAGFQALVQFSDPDTATMAKNALDGRSIPRYLLPDHVTSCHLRISFSAHTDLNVKFQSHRSRDYTNPNLPVNPSAIDGQFTIGPDGKRKELESNVLLASIENMQYAVTVDVLNTVFSAFGTVQKIAIFEKNGGFQALIQYPDIATAVVAKEALEGHCIYDGGFCKLHLSYSRHTDLNVKGNNDRSRDFTAPASGILQSQPSPHTAATPANVGGWQIPPPGPMYSANGYVGNPCPPPPGGHARPQPLQGWEYNQSQVPSQTPGANALQSPAYAGQGSVPSPPMPSPPGLAGSNIGTSQFQPPPGHSPHLGPPMPHYSNQPMHMSMPGGIPPVNGGAPPGYYM